MTDRELLELAAKAAGIEVWWTENYGGVFLRDRNSPVIWNPLNDDGDALRLAVATKVLFDMQDHLGSLLFEEGAQPSHEHAVRRAIVRAAAAIAAAKGE
ncbi:hypothetical protein O987_06960 [Comamonas testosteroni TK102]|uniref:Uncharacterized protein n=1 Tax=Comamonas testosteroni TK102 TaxID=1392005 RepID=A0A076PPD6_COMTE|nr:hypothetical protein [Comamonas testosteroni]AIJ45535.1 hypothetical protein O987_06960 [Comamonas testosteroni TK102]